MNALSFGGGNSLGGLLVIVLIGAVTAQEYTWRTMHLWLSRGIPRPVLMGAKFVAILLPIFLFVVTPLLVGGGLTAIFTLQIDKSLPFGQINWWHLAMSVLRTAYTLLPYATLTFMLAIVTRSTAAAIGIGLAYTLLVESIASTVFPLLGGILAKIVVYLPGSLAEGVLKLNETAMVGRLVSAGNGISIIKYLDPDPGSHRYSLVDDPVPWAGGLVIPPAGYVGLIIVLSRQFRKMSEMAAVRSLPTNSSFYGEFISKEDIIILCAAFSPGKAF